MTSWLSTPEELAALRSTMDSQGKKLVLTNGCFDLLHVGHVRYLRQARELGDALVIALNSDASVRALKGPSRPVTTEEDRAEILRALSCVDRVVLFDEPRVTRLIEIICPHIYTKGGDYTVESLNPEEKAALDHVGAKIEILPLVPGRSTTANLKKLSEKEQPDVLRLGVLGSGRGSNFEAIHQAIQDGRLTAKIEVVISDIADSRIVARARELGYPTIIVGSGTASGKLGPAAQKEICEHLQRHHVQVVALAGYMRILRDPTLTAFEGRIVNVHPSLLPKHKGLRGWEQAFRAGDAEAGCTIHLVNGEVDGGETLAQSKVPILPHDTVDSLYQRIQVEEHRLYPQVLAEWRSRGLPVAE